MHVFESFALFHGNCLGVLRHLPDNSVDAIVTDPPYGLKFMGKKWDYDVPPVEIWEECLRVLKPGGYLLSFAGTKTHHRMAVNIEDAGFEIRDMVAWLYGSGFPKSMNVGKAIDKAAGKKREVIGQREDILKKQAADLRRGERKIVDSFNAGAPERNNGFKTVSADVTAPATPEAEEWEGWGTALKPAMEPITVARKPLAGTVVKNVLEHGTGAINIDDCRVGNSKNVPASVSKRTQSTCYGEFAATETQGVGGHDANTGRWPANVIHDGSDEVVEQFPNTKDGSADRFFYCAKASKKDRGEDNKHPTVKPTDLMRYLCRLVTPPGGIVLDPFMGSGSTGKAAFKEGFFFIGIEMEKESYDTALSRLEELENE